MWWLLASCAAHDSDGVDINLTGGVDIELTLSNMFPIDSAEYSITGPIDVPLAGNWTGTDETVPFRAHIGEVVDGKGYVLAVDALAWDRMTSCSGSTTFDVVGDRTTQVSLELQCSELPDISVLDPEVQRERSGCPPMGSSTVTPGDDDSTFQLHALPSDADATGMSFQWWANLGSIDDGAGRDATFRCPDTGGYLSIDLTLRGRDCVERITLHVQCAPPSVGHCDEPDDTTAIRSDESRAVAFQIDPQHSGTQPNDTLRLPLKPRWAHDFKAGVVSYPLVASGRVFVTVGGGSGGEPSLYALAADSGDIQWGPVGLGGTSVWANATYDDERVFAVSREAVLTAYAADGGERLWTTQLPGQSRSNAPPTAYGGHVYVSASGFGGTLYAIAEADGSVEWSAPVASGQVSSPAVSPAGVFVSYACNQTYAFSLRCGNPLWQHLPSGCEGEGGGSTVALIGDRVYTRYIEGNLVLDAHDGTTLGSYKSFLIPAGTSDMLYTTVGDTLYAQDPSSSAVSWHFGGGALTAAPIRVGRQIVVGGQDGDLNVLAAEDGSLVSTYQLGSAVGSSLEPNPSGPLSGMAAAGNQLYVPAGSTLTAF